MKFLKMLKNFMKSSQCFKNIYELHTNTISENHIAKVYTKEISVAHGGERIKLRLEEEEGMLDKLQSF